MTFPDVNLLLYAYDAESEFHRSAANWLEKSLDTEQVYFSWQTLTGFLRIITSPSGSNSPAQSCPSN